MSNISKAFEGKKAFIPFVTAGDPTVEKTVEFILTLEEAGADLIELGVPFSDPMAEGPVIQAANARALLNNTTLNDVFDIVKKVREKSNIPLVFLTYLNPVHHFGYEAFFTKCQNLGVDGIIIPDLPYEEKNEITKFAKNANVDVISLIAPTSRERVKTIAQEAEGFIYLVSSMGVTGVRAEIETDLESFVKAIREVTCTPVAIGFGINTPKQVEDMGAISDGVIVGSAIVKIIEKYGENATAHLKDYVRLMKSCTERI